MANISGWIYFAITTLLFIVFVGIVIYYFSPRRKQKVEDPKYKMLDDE
jgi:cbb3-type cytochrome oxidase subunit 3